MNERARQVQEAIELGKHGTLDEIRLAKAILETTLEQAGGGQMNLSTYADWLTFTRRAEYRA